MTNQREAISKWLFENLRQDSNFYARDVVLTESVWQAAQASLSTTQDEPVALNMALTKLKELPRFTFLSPKEGGVKRYADKSGNWIEHYEAVKILDDLIYEPTLYTSPSNSDRVKELEEENLKLKATIEMYKGAKKCTDCNLEWTDSNLDCPKCGKEVTL